MSGRIGAAAATFLAFAACEEPVDVDDWGIAGYAIVEGQIERVSGEAFTGSVFVSCGLDAPGFFGNTYDTDSPAHYTAQLQWPDATMAAPLEARGWWAICRVSVPGNSLPFAMVTDSVRFARTKDDQVRYRIDLREGAS